MTRSTPIAAGLAGLLMMICATAPGQEPEARPAAPAPAQARGGFPDLVQGLKETEGCLGVETARTSTGKNVIFAWFSDRKAVARWYHSAMHRQVMSMMDTPGTPNPLKHVKDDAGPLLVVASLTRSDQPRLEGVAMPISQISVEIYAVQPGGASMGGTFAPAGVAIPHHQRLDAETAPSEPMPDQPAAGKPAADKPAP
jgi:hypothetical protein